MNNSWKTYSNQLPPVTSRVCNRLFLNPSTGQVSYTQNPGDIEVVKVYHEHDGMPTTQYIPAKTSDLLTTIKGELKPFFRRIVVLGASLMESCFGRNTITNEPELNSFYTNYIQTVHGKTDCEVYGYGFSGDDVSTFLSPNKLQAMYDFFAQPDTLFFVHIGGNDVTDNRPYNSGNNYTTLLNNIAQIEALAKARGNAVILGSITFRSYLNGRTTPLPTIPTYTPEQVFNDESLGSKPFWDNLFQPIYNGNFYIRNNLPIIDLYNFTRNYHTGLLHTDGIHIHGHSLALATRKNTLTNQFFGKFIIDEIVKYYSGNYSPMIRREPVLDRFAISVQQNSGLIPLIPSTGIRAYPLLLNNYMNFNSIAQCNTFTTTVRTPTGHPFCTLATSTDATSWSGLGTSHMGRTSLDPDSGNYIDISSYETYDTYNSQIERTQVGLQENLYFSKDRYFQVTLSGLSNGNYTISCSASRRPPSNKSRTTQCSLRNASNTSDVASMTYTVPGSPWNSLNFTVNNGTAIFRFTNLGGTDSDTNYGDLSCIQVVRNP